MYSLGLDSTSGLHIVIFNDNNLVAELKLQRGEVNVADEIIPSILRLLDSLGIKVADLGFITLIRGPGFFTGLRIGIVVAKVLQRFLKIPCISFSAMEVMVKEAIDIKGGTFVISCIDIGKTGAVVALFDAHCEYVMEEHYVEESSIESLFKTEIGNSYLLVGNKQNLFCRYKEQYNIIFCEEIVVPNLLKMQEMGYSEYLRNAGLRNVEPLYGKEPDVVVRKIAT